MILKMNMVLLIFVISLSAGFKEVTIVKERDNYILDFNVTYVTFVTPGIELKITLPDGYSFASKLSGLERIVRVGKMRNAIYVTLTQEQPGQELVTNMNLDIECPDKSENSLIFKLIAKRNSPRILAIHFIAPGASDQDKIAEKLKSRYTQQMNQALSDQERVLDSKIHLVTVANGIPLFINERRGSVACSYNGATAFLEGIYNSRGETYIYLRADARRNDNCDIIRLVRAGHLESMSDASLAYSIDNGDGTITYVYRIPEVQLIFKKNRYHQFKFGLQVMIWSKIIEIYFYCS